MNKPANIQIFRSTIWVTPPKQEILPRLTLNLFGFCFVLFPQTAFGFDNVVGWKRDQTIYLVFIIPDY